MAVTLTFDNGPSTATTAQVLDVLRDRRLLATFFVVGTALERRGARDLAERATSEGHWIGNHSMTHATPLGDETDDAVVAHEIEAAEMAIGALAHERRFFRPFGGGGIIGEHLLSPGAVDLLHEGGYTCVLWTSVPRDWEDPVGWVDVALADVDESDHTVVVLHDLPTGAMDALPRFLDALDARGQEVVQDFPDAVIAIDCGVVRDLTGIVRS